MSSYRRDTIHPETGKVESAMWIDDYFGRHRYGVQFPDGKVFKPEETEFPLDDDEKMEVIQMAKVTNDNPKKLIQNLRQRFGDRQYLAIEFLQEVCK